VYTFPDRAHYHTGHITGRQAKEAQNLNWYACLPWPMTLRIINNLIKHHKHNVLTTNATTQVTLQRDKNSKEAQILTSNMRAYPDQWPYTVYVTHRGKNILIRDKRHTFWNSIHNALTTNATTQVTLQRDKNSKEAQKAAERAAKPPPSSGLDAFLAEVEKKKKVSQPRQVVDNV